MISDKAKMKKVFFNRVRRTCLKYDLDIEYDGVPKNYNAVFIMKDGKVIFADRREDNAPLDIDWQRIHEQMFDYGFIGGVK
jgi:hypothetical protein|tara:strand:- start:3918 stop:4160 length:243 start_codon:yes stop_codon:yes gene_type:complete